MDSVAFLYRRLGFLVIHNFRNWRIVPETIHVVGCVCVVGRACVVSRAIRICVRTLGARARKRGEW